MKKNKSNLIFGAVIVLIILAIFLLWPNEEDVTRETMQCIADHSTLYVSKTCGHCAHQKELLGDYLELFEPIDCSENQQECISNEIVSVPTWIINGEQHRGVQELNELKNLTRC
ncbi:MAG: hypothetical protein ABH864_05925 [archaeon]